MPLHSAFRCLVQNTPRIQSTKDYPHFIYMIDFSANSSNVERICGLCTRHSSCSFRVWPQLLQLHVYRRQGMVGLRCSGVVALHDHTQPSMGSWPSSTFERFRLCTGVFLRHCNMLHQKSRHTLSPHTFSSVQFRPLTPKLCELTTFVHSCSMGAATVATSARKAVP